MSKQKKKMEGYLTDLLIVLKYKAQDYIKKKNQNDTKNLSSAVIAIIGREGRS